MTDVTLTVDGYTFTFNPGDVEKVDEDINAQPEQTDISRTGPMGAYVYDYAGVLKTITISGFLTTAATTRISGYTITTLTQQKQWLESLANGSQSGITITSNYSSSSVSQKVGSTPPYLGSFVPTTCKVGPMKFTERTGDIERIPFNMTFYVGVSF